MFLQFTKVSIHTVSCGILYFYSLSLSHTQVSYSFAEGTANSITSTFSLDAMTGVILLEGAIDFESGVMSYDFVVVARDGGTPARSSTASVRLFAVYLVEK